MTTGTLPQQWSGQSGRRYVPAPDGKVRHGGMATVRKVVGTGGSVGTSTVADGVPVALKLWHEGDEASLDQLQTEARILVTLTARGGDLPCPRLYDLVGTPLVVGLVMEWCPADLERWWRGAVSEPDGLGQLFAVLGEVCRRLADYHEAYGSRRGLTPSHGDVKPTNILLASDGRWLVSDFGAAIEATPDDNPWATSKVIVGTENFLSPEALFRARMPFPAAMDTWAIGATTLALLRMRRMVLDGAPMPRNGTHSPRFRSQRMNQAVELFGADPGRFRDRDLDPDAFPDPLRLPGEDRATVMEGLRGAFSAPAPDKEAALADELLQVLDRAMSVDPTLRYTDARDLAAAFDRLARTWIELGADVAPAAAAAPEPNLREERDKAARRARLLEDEVTELRSRLSDLEAREQTAPRATGISSVAIAALAAFAGLQFLLILLLVVFVLMSR